MKTEKFTLTYIFRPSAHYLSFNGAFNPFLTDNPYIECGIAIDESSEDLPSICKGLKENFSVKLKPTSRIVVIGFDAVGYKDSELDVPKNCSIRVTIDSDTFGERKLEGVVKPHEPCNMIKVSINFKLTTSEAVKVSDVKMNKDKMKSALDSLR